MNFIKAKQTYVVISQQGTAMLGYIHNRWICPRHHVVIKHPDYSKGTYFDKDTTLLFASFQILVDFVELECGHDHHYLTPMEKWYRKVQYAPVIGWFLPPLRNRLQGLHYLRWAMKLKDVPAQGAHAKEVFRLYKWWTHERPSRVDPWDDYATLREGRDWKGSLTLKEKRLLKKCQRLEDKYDKEDEKNLIALMKIRQGLWT